MTKNFKLNNFDLLRLIAAFQVATFHAFHIMDVKAGWLGAFYYITSIIPGVPIFFFISGFLISKSYENNSSLHEYLQNRVLRLYPGLIICVSLSFLLIYVSGYFSSVSVPMYEWIILFVAKTTFIQFYNTDFMRSYGDGVLNGSLWTITVELQFYLLVPLIYRYFNLMARRRITLKLVLLITVFLLFNRLFTYIPGEYHSHNLYKLYGVSFLPWFYMFLLGVFFQKHFEFFFKILKNKLIFIAPLYVIVAVLSKNHSINLGNNINPLLYLMLVIMVFSFAYSYVNLARTLLKGNDISYGIYIYHMPIVNFLIYTGVSGDVHQSFLALLLTIFAASVSWFVIEKPSLMLKRHPLNPLNKNKG